MPEAKPRLAELAIEAVIANPRNDNLHPRDQIERLVQSIQRFGQPRPILVRQANHMIIAGHGVHEAMRQAGLARIAVLLWDVDQATADQYLVADNRFSELSVADPERRRSLLEGFAALDFGALGFLPAEVEKLFLEGPEPIGVIELETGTVEDEFWITVRGPLRQQAGALQRLQQVMRDLPEIEVELGSLAGGP
jgi:hypothetical protein